MASLTSVKLPNTLLAINGSAFKGCTGLKSIEIPNSVQRIEDWAFNGCGLETVEIPNSVTTIDAAAFIDCPNLSSVTIGNSVAEISASAFSGCKSLKEIKLLGATPPSVQKTTFDKNAYANIALNVPEGALEAYQAAPVWSNFYSLFPVDDTVRGKAKITVNGQFGALAGSIVDKVIVYGEDPEKEPAFSPAPWDGYELKFSDSEGKHFPTLSEEVYWGYKTLIFDISDVSEDASMRVMNGWWSNTYIDNFNLYDQLGGSNGSLEITITETIAKECSKGGGGRDLMLLLTSGTATFHQVYYEDEEPVFSLKDDGDQTFEYEILREAKLKITGQDEGNDITVTLDGEAVASEKADKFEATVTLKPGSQLTIGNDVLTGISTVSTDPKSRKTFNLQGVEVGDGYRGIVIQNGKKMLKR